MFSTVIQPLEGKLPHRFNNFFKGFRIILGEVGEDFAVEGDILFLEHGNEFGVGEAVFLESGGEAHVPEAAEVAFLVLSVGEGVGAGMHDGFVGHALFGRAAVAVALDLAQDIAATLQCIDSFLNSAHIS